jgi:hypothetical protein
MPISLLLIQPFKGVRLLILSTTEVWARLLTHLDRRTKTDHLSDMPFKSEKQRKYLYAKEPAVAQKFQREENKKKKAKEKKR